MGKKNESYNSAARNGREEKEEACTSSFQMIYGIIHRAELTQRSGVLKNIEREKDNNNNDLEDFLTLHFLCIYCIKNVSTAHSST